MPKKYYVISGESYKDYKVKQYNEEDHKSLLKPLYSDDEIYDNFEVVKIDLLKKLDAEKATIDMIINCVETTTEDHYFDKEN